jgi:formylglycine-generating enzyme required for sulfatase activity
MGDVFGEGRQDEIPTHLVTVHDYLLSPNEVTVAEFEEFVAETGYETSAEGTYDPDAYRATIERAASGQLSRQEMQELRDELLRYSGAGYWAAEERQWQGYNPETNWRNPGFAQAPDHPVQAVSWDDAISFCNWLSEKAGLPVAYDLETGALLDGSGNPTSDLSAVRGYRLPTEAEWEYAARERGRDVRFGTGSDTARSSEMNFRGDEGEQPFTEPGSYRKGTTPVGSFPPNALGLHDMSGNAWEWASDAYVAYDTTALDNPYMTDGSERILRGGRWGGDAFEARVFHRTSWPRNDRCNNSGFRIARSAGGR